MISYLVQAQTLLLVQLNQFAVSFNVSAAVEQVFKIGSMEPGAMLFDAFKEFEASGFLPCACVKQAA